MPYKDNLSFCTMRVFRRRQNQNPKFVPQNISSPILRKEEEERKKSMCRVYTDNNVSGQCVNIPPANAGGNTLIIYTHTQTQDSLRKRVCIGTTRGSCHLCICSGVRLLVVEDDAVLPLNSPLSSGGAAPHFPSDSVGSRTLTDPSVKPMANWFGSWG